jgi:hypothetical protein
MNGIDPWRIDLRYVIDQLALGLDLFGPYAAWLWVMPAIWAATGLFLWAHVAWRRRQADRAYLAYVSRNLPLLRKIAKQRAKEAAYAGRDRGRW